MIGGINLAPEERLLDGTLLVELIRLWLERADIKKITREHYKDKVDHFVGWWTDVGPRQKYILSRDDLKRFNRHLTLTGLSFTSRNDVMRRLKTMFKWAKSQHMLDHDYSDWIPEVEGRKQLRTIPALDQVFHLIRSLDSLENPERSKALIALQLGVGMRRAETSSVNVESIEFYGDGSGTIIVPVTKQTESDNQPEQRLTAFDAATGQHIRPLYDKLKGEGVVSGPFLRKLTQPSQRLMPMGVYRATKAIFRQTGIADHIEGCQDLRRLFYTSYLRFGGDKDLLKKQVGHSSQDVGAFYDYRDAADLRNDISSVYAVAAAHTLTLHVTIPTGL